MDKCLYELSKDKKSLLITHFWINEGKIKEYKQKYLNEKSKYWKLYKLETNVDLANLKENKVISYFEHFDENNKEEEVLPHIRIVENRVDTLFEKNKRDIIIKSYINGETLEEKKYVVLLLPPYKEAYKIPIQGQDFNPFMYGELYFSDEVIKIPLEIGALDLFMEEKYDLLTKTRCKEYIPWQLFEEYKQQRIASEILNSNSSTMKKRKENLESSTKLLKLYKEYKMKKGD